jgi:hypothetical protein
VSDSVKLPGMSEWLCRGALPMAKPIARGKTLKRFAAPLPEFVAMSVLSQAKSNKINI